jgi:hypothetical protein
MSKADVLRYRNKNLNLAIFPSAGGITSDSDRVDDDAAILLNDDAHLWCEMSPIPQVIQFRASLPFFRLEYMSEDQKTS